MKILIIDNGTKYLDELRNLVASHEVEVIPSAQYDMSATPRCNLIILSGGGHGRPLQGFESNWQEELDLTRGTTIPLLGICFGFELMAAAYGYKLDKCEKPIRGLRQIRATLNDEIFQGQSKFTVYESHRWRLNHIAAPYEVLTTSSRGIEIVKNMYKLHYGFQFHPEKSTGPSSGRDIFANLLKIVQIHPYEIRPHRQSVSRPSRGRGALYALGCCRAPGARLCDYLWLG